LGTVLFPGALLPLQLFELRYLQMIGECERQGTGFGVVTLTQGREVHRPGQAAEQFEAFGTRVQIERIERPQPGLVMVWCRGVEKFRIEATQQRSDGLWLGKVQALPLSDRGQLAAGQCHRPCCGLADRYLQHGIRCAFHLRVSN
jgi:Lon protease-like protein